MPFRFGEACGRLTGMSENDQEQEQEQEQRQPRRPRRVLEVAAIVFATFVAAWQFFISDSVSGPFFASLWSPPQADKEAQQLHDIIAFVLHVISYVGAFSIGWVFAHRPKYIYLGCVVSAIFTTWLMYGLTLGWSLVFFGVYVLAAGCGYHVRKIVEGDGDTYRVSSQEYRDPMDRREWKRDSNP